MGKVTGDGGAKSKQITGYAREQLILTDGREDVRSPNLRNLECCLNHWRNHCHLYLAHSEANFDGCY
jgi:hypothetical protein